MSSQAASILQARREEIQNIDVTQGTWSKIKEWHARTRPVIAKYYPDQANKFDEIIKIEWVQTPRAASSTHTGRSVSVPKDSMPLYHQQKRSRTSPENSISPTKTGSKSVGTSANDTKAKSVQTQLINFLDALIELDSTSVVSNQTTTESDFMFDQIETSLQSSALSSEFKRIIRNDLLESKTAYAAGAFKSCVVMLGAAIEGLMLGTLLRNDVIAFLRTPGSAAPAPIRDLGLHDPKLEKKIGNDLTFDSYRQCIYQLVPTLDDLGIENIQSFRNAVHPWKTIQDPTKYGSFDRSRALVHISSFTKIIDVLSQWTPR